LRNDEGINKPATEFQKNQEYGDSGVEDRGIGKGSDHMPSGYHCEFWCYIHFQCKLVIFDNVISFSSHTYTSTPILSSKFK
jgi:hypothetical protein